MSRLNTFVAEVTGRLKSYRIQDDNLWYSFVDRELEVTRILDPRVGGLSSTTRISTCLR